MPDYDAYAAEFISARSESVGVDVVLAWAASLPAAGRVLDLGCGHGVPIARALAERGYVVHGVDISPRLVEAFLRSVPGSTAERGDARSLRPRPAGFDGVVLWGLLFLLDPAGQEAAIGVAASALRPGGRLLATAPWQSAEWNDLLTGQPCVSLGRERYRSLLRAAGLTVTGEAEDGGGNHYWFAERPAATRDRPESAR